MNRQVQVQSPVSQNLLFPGADQYLREIAAAVQIPVLRKDFTVDEYMIYQAKSLGASAVLLICAILDDGELRAYRQLAKELGLDALVEAHDEYEVDRALNLGAEIVGVNNRDLRTFQVDMNNSIRLRKMAPDNVVFVSESGIRTPEDIRLLYEDKVDAVLIGETLMRSEQESSAGKPEWQPVTLKDRILSERIEYDQRTTAKNQNQNLWSETPGRHYLCK